MRQNEVLFWVLLCDYWVLLFDLTPTQHYYMVINYLMLPQRNTENTQKWLCSDVILDHRLVCHCLYHQSFDPVFFC